MKTSTRFPLFLFLFLLLMFALPFTHTALLGQSTQYQRQTEQQSGGFSDRFFLGGDLGLQFGTVTIINVSPLLGYKLTEDLAMGVGITYQYYKDRRYEPDFSTSIYGGRVFGRYYILENLFAHAEYEVLNYDAVFVDALGSLFQDRITANNVYVGGGYSQPIGGSACIELMILYNLNESAQSLYENPIIRMGINVGM